MTTLPRDPFKPLPEKLRLSLLAIRETGVSCRDVERLYEATRLEARGGEAEPEVRAHLAGCTRCRMVYGTLRASFRAIRRPLPRGLARRLRQVASRPRLPLLVRDGRLAVAASALLTAALMLLMGNPADFFQSTTSTMSSGVTVLAETGEERGQALWETVANQVETRYERGREVFTARGFSYERLWHEARDYYENREWRQLFPSAAVEGEDDGES